MKKLALLLSLLLVLSALSACTTAKKPTDGTAEGSAEQTTEKPVEVVYPALDVWDGTVAEGFAAGSGTEADPYLIATGAQLAYLAKSVNEGNAYSGQVIALAADVDLNDREWTPIGNSRDHAFEGTFDGKEHTVSRLSITKRTDFRYEYTEGQTAVFTVFGLFGVCRNANFANLAVSKAFVSIPEKEASYSVSIGAGILAGALYADAPCSVSNVQVSEATVHSVMSENSLNIGGLFGGLFGIGPDPTNPFTLDRVQSFLSVSRKYYWGSYAFNHVGAIIGEVSNISTMECRNFRSDLTLECPDYEQPGVGAFNVYSGGQVRLENGFCVVKVFPSYVGQETTHAVVGEKNALWGAAVQCKNLFGRVMPKEEALLTNDPRITSQRKQELANEYFYSLYSITPIPERGGSLTEENCVACDALPEDHGLDPAVWDLSDPADPRLKFGGRTLPTHAASPASDFESTPTTDGSGTVITNYTGTDKTVVIPAEINGLPVVGVGGYTGEAGKLTGAFQGSGVRSVFIPDTVEAIHSNAFADCTGLTDVIFGGRSRLKLLSFAFPNCTALETLDLALPELSHVDSHSFAGCTNLRTVYFGFALTRIGPSAFENCTSLVQLLIPKGLTELEDRAFCGCTSLRSVNFPSTLTNVKGSPFADCTALKSVSFQEGAKTCLWGYGAFVNCTSLQSMTFPTSMERIDASLFLISSLKEIFFFGPCPQIDTIDYGEFKSGMTIHYDPRNEGWDPWPWSDPCSHASLVS